MSGIGNNELGNLTSPQSCLATWAAERKAYATFCEYLRAVDDHMQCERAGACFTEDTEISYHMGGRPMVFRGRPAFVRYLEGAKLVHEMSVHVVGQHRFAWRDGRPRITAYVSAWHWFLENAQIGETRPVDFMTIGYAEDEFTLTGGEWLISRRLVRPVAGLVALGTRPPAAIKEAGAD